MSFVYVHQITPPHILRVSLPAHVLGLCRLFSLPLYKYTMQAREHPRARGSCHCASLQDGVADDLRPATTAAVDSWISRKVCSACWLLNLSQPLEPVRVEQHTYYSETMCTAVLCKLTLVCMHFYGLAVVRPCCRLCSSTRNTGPPAWICYCASLGVRDSNSYVRPFVADYFSRFSWATSGVRRACCPSTHKETI